MASKKTHILKSDNNIEFLALGITSSESEFQLSHTLNSFLPIKLTIGSPFEKTIKEKSAAFSTFRYDNETSLQIILIKNKINRFILFPSQVAFDFVILLSGEEALQTANAIMERYKSLQNISLVAYIDIKKLGSIKNYLK